MKLDIKKIFNPLLTLIIVVFSGLISIVEFEKYNGSYLVVSFYDCSITKVILVIALILIIVSFIHIALVFFDREKYYYKWLFGAIYLVCSFILFICFMHLYDPYSPYNSRGTSLYLELLFFTIYLVHCIFINLYYLFNDFIKKSECTIYVFLAIVIVVLLVVQGFNGFETVFVPLSGGWHKNLERISFYDVYLHEFYLFLEIAILLLTLLNVYKILVNKQSWKYSVFVDLFSLIALCLVIFGDFILFAKYDGSVKVMIRSFNVSLVMAFSIFVYTFLGILHKTYITEGDKEDVREII